MLGRRRRWGLFFPCCGVVRGVATTAAGLCWKPQPRSRAYHCCLAMRHFAPNLVHVRCFVMSPQSTSARKRRNTAPGTTSASERGVASFAVAEVGAARSIEETAPRAQVAPIVGYQLLKYGGSDSTAFMRGSASPKIYPRRSSEKFGGGWLRRVKFQLARSPLLILLPITASLKYPKRRFGRANKTIIVLSLLPQCAVCAVSAPPARPITGVPRQNRPMLIGAA